MAAGMSEVQFRCTICLDIFNNPVSIPCGHNFCLECIKRFWDTRRQADCPLCKDAFRPRPELKVNLGLKDITEHFKKSLKDKPVQKPVPKRRSQRLTSRMDVPCDVCQGPSSTAVKSCLICQASYCETHLVPHLRDPVMTKHMLLDPDTFTHFCRHHNKHLEMYCKTDQIPVCVKCVERDHKHHDIVPIQRESNRIKSEMKKTDAEFQQMIQTRIRKVEEIKKSMQQRQTNKEKEINASVQVFTMVVSAIESNQALLIAEIEQEHEAMQKTGEESLKQLDQEINDLQKRRSQLQNMENNEDPLLLLQNFSSLSSPPSTMDWSKVSVHPNIYIGTVRRAFSKLLDVCHDLENKLSEDEVRKLHRYAVDITMDPMTAAGWLVLSPDGKKVSLCSQHKKLSNPDDPRRFNACVAVLAHQSFTSGRCYWVVQVGDKTDWDLGVAKESINRKGAITVRPDSGYWAICRRKGGCLSACAGPSVTLHLQGNPQKVGVFLDYDEGLVSFFNADAKTHIYTYSGCTFNEPLYPYFNPCLHDNGRNTAPLFICPVEPGLPGQSAAF